MADEQKTDEKTKETEITASSEPAKEKQPEKPNYSNLKSGMTVKVHQKIQEVGKKGEAKERIQVFEGMIIASRGAGLSRTITVRKISNGVGVEKIFPVYLPTLVKIEPLRQAKVRRAKLYYLRDYKKKLREKKI